MRCWAPKGMRPIIGKQIVREYVYVYAAVCPEKGVMSSLILPYANTEMMNIFLQQVSKDFQEYFIIMQVDQAAWHLSHSLNLPENIRFIQQPAHSPELNPVEHIWDDLKEKDLPNRVFDTIEQVIDNLCKGIKRLMNNKNYLSSLTYFPHLKITL